MLYLAIPLLTVLLLLLTLFLLGRYAARVFSHGKRKSEEETFRLCTEQYNDFDREWFDSQDFEPFTVSS
ncbi:MAG: hypothetical protein PQJ60_02195, partial [Spirochaetales bacterium]|nr:hypothetical protein [Spirochaetales bacterium]